MLDQGLATLLADLSERGLLDSTLVWCTGEFGRTPKVSWEPPWNGGRHHHGDVFTVLVAGGGFKGGHVVGLSDEKGEKVKERPVYPADLLGSMYLLAGIDATAKLPHPWGLDAHVLDTENEGMKFRPGCWKKSCSHGAEHGGRSCEEAARPCSHPRLQRSQEFSPMPKRQMMEVFMSRLNRLPILGLAMLLAAASSVRAQSQYIGYVYPAGGQQGTTFPIRLGDRVSFMPPI